MNESSFGFGRSFIDEQRPLKASALLKPLGLNNQDLVDFEAFLKAASEPYVRMRPSELPPAEEQTAAAK